MTRAELRRKKEFAASVVVGAVKSAGAEGVSEAELVSAMTAGGIDPKRIKSAIEELEWSERVRRSDGRLRPNVSLFGSAATT